MVLYMIGGSPCSGKSTIASLLARQYQLLHIKLDDLVEEMMNQASADSQPICLLRQDRNPEQIWMRNPKEMADEEWRFYEEIFPYVKSYLIKNQNRPLLVEGAGLLPHLVKEAVRLGYPSLITDGSQSEKQTAEEIARIFKLLNRNNIILKEKTHD